VQQSVRIELVINLKTAKALAMCGKPGPDMLDAKFSQDAPISDVDQLGKQLRQRPSEGRPKVLMKLLSAVVQSRRRP
jgi:hypothetical protein